MKTQKKKDGVKKCIHLIEKEINQEFNEDELNPSIIKAYTLDSFIYSEVNQLLRNKDQNWQNVKIWLPYIGFLLG